MFNKEILYLTGAYGREAVESDWDNGKDMKIVSGPYCSIRDCEAIKIDNGGVESLLLVFINARGSVLFMRAI
jgi:hypothetical protein